MASALVRLRRRIFNDQISTGEYLLYARVGNESAPFKQLNPAIGRHLEITDWENGAAVAPDGTKYFEIHVQRSEANILSVLSVDSVTGPRTADKKMDKQQPDSNWLPLRTILPFSVGFDRIQQELLQRLKAALDNHALKSEIAIFACPGVDAPFKSCQHITCLF